MYERPRLGSYSYHTELTREALEVRQFEKNRVTHQQLTPFAPFKGLIPAFATRDL